MSPLVLNIIVAVVALVIGIAIGILVKKAGQSETQAGAQLASVKSEFQQYQQQVAAHMTKTTELFEGLHEHFNEIQEHLFAAEVPAQTDGSITSLKQPHSHYIRYANEAEPDVSAKHDKASIVDTPKDYPQ